MDQGTLVTMQIDNGNRLISRLVEAGVPVTAAAWLQESESGQWFLYLVTPLVEDGATRDAYRRVNAVIRQMPPPFGMDPLDIKVVGPDSRTGEAIQQLQARLLVPTPFRYGGIRFGDVIIEAASVYPPAVPADNRS
jgi:hypothetical protein